MLEKFLDKKVVVYFFTTRTNSFYRGVVTAVDKDFIELDNNLTIAIKYIISIESK